MNKNILCTEMYWPSKRIPQGGMLHPRKVVYSLETHEMLKIIMDEMKLTMFMRRKLDWCLRSGKSINDIGEDRDGTKNLQNETNIRPRTSRMRSYNMIKESGDLERERYHPTRRTEDRELIKKRLQDIMEFGREMQTTTLKMNKHKKPTKKVKTKIPSRMDMIYDLLSQIQEREDWLHEMETLGEGSKHREVIQAQIAERIRKIEAIENVKDNIEGDKALIISANTEVAEGEQFNKSENTTNIEIKEILRDEKCENDMKNTKQISETDGKNPGHSISEKKCKQLSDKGFGKMFTNTKERLIDNSSTTRKENLRGFCIDGASCLSERSNML